MRRLAPVLLVLLVALIGHAASPSASRLAQRKIDIVRLAADCCSGLETPARLVVREPAAWRETWASIWSTRMPAPSLPDVDFTRDMIVVAAMGTRGSGGYSISIDSAEARPGGRLDVHVRSISPGRDCILSQALTQPVDVARLPRHEGQVTFVERNDVQECR